MGGSLIDLIIIPTSAELLKRFQSHYPYHSNFVKPNQFDLGWNVNFPKDEFDISWFKFTSLSSSLRIPFFGRDKILILVKLC